MTQLPTKSVEQRLIHHGHTWEQFKLIQKGFEGFPGVRLFYYEGTIEILMPGQDHEFFSRIIAMLLHVFFEEIGEEFAPTARWIKSGKALSRLRQMNRIASGT